MVSRVLICLAFAGVLSRAQTETKPAQPGAAGNAVKPATASEPQERQPPNVRAWNLLMKEVGSDNPDHRKQAVVAIGSIGLAAEAIEILEKALHDKDPAVRQTAAAMLGEMKSHKSTEALQNALGDDSPEVAFTAAKSLWDMGEHERCREFLLEVMTGQRKDAPGFITGAKRDAMKKMHSPKALAMMGVREASGALLGPASMGVYAAQEMMKDGQAPGRVIAATLVSQDCDARVLQLLEWAIDNDKNKAARAGFARALGRCGTKDDIPRLEPLLDADHVSERDMAAAAIVKLYLAPAPKPTAAAGRAYAPSGWSPKP